MLSTVVQINHDKHSELLKKHTFLHKFLTGLLRETYSAMAVSIYGELYPWLVVSCLFLHSGALSNNTFTTY